MILNPEVKTQKVNFPEEVLEPARRYGLEPRRD